MRRINAFIAILTIGFLINTGKTFSQIKDKPYVIFISADGFRYDYATKFNASNLLRLSSGGVKAKRMVPSYPSVTRPNHYSLVTGLYPGHTGIAGNTFYDPKSKTTFNKAEGKWFTSQSIWQTASKSDVITANINYPDARTITKGMKDVYQIQKSKEITIDDQLDAIQEWLKMPEGKRPHLITLYFNDADHQGHIYGPEAVEVADAAKKIDDNIGRIDALVKSIGLPVDIIFVSDHGMIDIDKSNIIPIPTAVDTMKFVVNNQNSLVNIFAKDPSFVMNTYRDLLSKEKNEYKVYLNSNLPQNWFYGGNDDKHGRAGDIILVAQYPKTFNNKAGKGMHGFDPEKVAEMGASFMAWGPSFKKGIIIEQFKNVEVYHLLSTMLRLQINMNDAKGMLSREILN
ncbi:alkaline phosphatase family protein [Pedobacter roseus]|uniref:Alkaline phosphatase family protein n=1 Tax=Pedobacter roseus TaxID=336820 RepID=A0A7G9QI01_9SPHI|nr:ectonucleotide pyrophosphatase/phosphodiesterase [Pedobacter roseus]QNN42976.1 alkaline phosphatase family protein [Pedobacter roseus]